MPRYKATRQLFINDTLLEPGAEFESDGVPHTEAWEPLDDAAKAAVEAARSAAKERAREIREAEAAASAGGGADVSAFVLQLAAMAERIGKLESQIAGVSAAAPDMGAFATTAAVAELSGQIGTVQTALTALTGRVGTAETNISTAQKDVSELDAGLQIVSGQVADVQGTLTALAEKVATPTAPTPPAPAPVDPAAPADPAAPTP